ncbi:MAG: ABC transporter ATP-binding protein [Planctomycetota bacterium]
MSELAIEARGISKRYKMFPSPTARIKEALYHGRKAFHTPVFALTDINLTLPKGSALGIIGSNGAGKSTLLKILAGTTLPTAGTFEVHGKVASLLELGTGFYTGFTGRQNIFLNAAVMGFTRTETKARLEEIIEFSELGPFIDQQVRTYSSGMVMRLGFSVATAVNPDVLIIDEILAVGDMHFQKKCLDRIFEFRASGKSILFCSHSLYDVRQICDRAIWLKDGCLAMEGDPVDVTHAYANFERSRYKPDDRKQTGIEQVLEPSQLEEVPRIESAELIDPRSGEPVTRIEMGDPLELVMEYRLPDPTPRINLGMGFYRSDNIAVATMATHLSGVSVPVRPGGVYRARVRMPAVKLIQGEFYVQVYIVDDRVVHIYDHRLLRRPLVVEQRTREVGLFLMDHEWAIEEIKAAAQEPSR